MFNKKILQMIQTLLSKKPLTVFHVFQIRLINSASSTGGEEREIVESETNNFNTNNL